MTDVIGAADARADKMPGGRAEMTGSRMLNPPPNVQESTGLLPKPDGYRPNPLLSPAARHFIICEGAARKNLNYTGRYTIIALYWISQKRS